MRGEDKRGWGGDGKPHHPRNQGRIEQRGRRREDGRARDGAAAAPTAGHVRGQRQHGDPAQAYCQHQRCQARKRHALPPRVRLTFANRASRRSSRCREPSKKVWPQFQQGDGQTGQEGDIDGGRNLAVCTPSAQHARSGRRGVETPEQSHALNVCVRLAWIVEGLLI